MRKGAAENLAKLSGSRSGVALIVAEVVTACTLPHFSIIKWLERPGYATLVVIGGGATFAVDVAKK